MDKNGSVPIGDECIKDHILHSFKEFALNLSIEVLLKRLKIIASMIKDIPSSVTVIKVTECEYGKLFDDELYEFEEILRVLNKLNIKIKKGLI